MVGTHGGARSAVAGGGVDDDGLEAAKATEARVIKVLLALADAVCESAAS